MRNKVKETPPQSTPYSHAEWAHSNLANFREAEDARHRSEEVSTDSICVLYTVGGSIHGKKTMLSL